MKYCSVENLNGFPQSDSFLSGIFEKFLLHVYVIVLSRYCTRMTLKHGQLHIASSL